MTKEKTKKIIKWGIIAVLGILYVNTCMITKVPDEITLINESETFKGYHELYDYIEYDIVPQKKLNIFFERSLLWPQENTDNLYIRGRLFTDNKDEKIYIKEVGYYYDGKYTVITKDENNTIYNNTPDIIVDEKKEPIIIDGKYLYSIWLQYWKNDSFGPDGKEKELRFDVGLRYRGLEKEIEIKQIYSVDNIIWHEEKYRYKIICGGKKFDITRPILNIEWLFAMIFF